jgi:hypothetical protein
MYLLFFLKASLLYAKKCDKEVFGRCIFFFNAIKF